jgi:serine/threonine protein kinase
VSHVVSHSLLTLGLVAWLAGFFMKQLFSALAYCHEKKICHRDIKSKNILLDDQQNCKFADFGSAKVVFNLSHNMQPSVSFGYTMSWVAPEVLSGTYNA